MFWIILSSLVILGGLIVTFFYFLIKNLSEAYKQTHEEGWEDPFK